MRNAESPALLRWTLAVLGVVLGVMPGCAWSQVTLPGIFSDHMVVQCDHEVPVWGWAAPGEQVAVSLNGIHSATNADAQGRWRVVLSAQKAGGPFQMSVTGNTTITIDDVLIGEVWFGAGQQNMEAILRDVDDARTEIAGANLPNYRQFQVERCATDVPTQQVAGRWRLCRPDYATMDCAVGYGFARELLRSRSVPVGFINASWNGSRGEVWMTRAAMMTHEELAPIVARSDATLMAWAKEMLDFRSEIDRWQIEADRAKAAGTVLPRLITMQHWVRDPLAGGDLAACMYNGMIAPLTSYAVRGVVWYQGEANAEYGWQYRTFLPALIAQWRTDWRASGAASDDLPFIIVQACGCQDPSLQPGDSTWAELRDAQLHSALTVPGCALAVTIDLGENKSSEMHRGPEVGRRVALQARARIYHEQVAHDGPILESMGISGNHALLHFRSDTGSPHAHSGTLVGFSIAGADRHFYWASATASDHTIDVSCAQVAQPVAVRYGWADNPVGCNLVGDDDLPTSPFRTDDWPALSRDRR